MVETRNILMSIPVPLDVHRDNNGDIRGFYANPLKTVESINRFIKKEQAHILIALSVKRMAKKGGRN